MAEILALAVVHSARSCSGGKVVIPFRAARVDATEAGPAGVPQPQENLQHHTSLFSKLGFNVSEMAGLVTCDHTLGGGVHGLTFRPSAPDTHDPVSCTFDSGGFASTDDGSRTIPTARRASILPSSPYQLDGLKAAKVPVLAFGPNTTT